MKNIREKIEEKLNQISDSEKDVSFFDWECPPRVKKVDSDGKIWFDFDLPLEKIVDGEMIDEFTELPKIITKEKETREILELLKEREALPLTKFVADTNWLYLYPETLKRMDLGRLKEISNRFVQLLQQKADEMFGVGMIKMVNYTDVQDRFRSDYEAAFETIMKEYDYLVPEGNKRAWEEFIVPHVGLQPEEIEYRKGLTKRVIASYAAEGIVFDLLEQNRIFSNPFWICLDEPEFVGDTTEILRKEKEIDPFPKIFI